MQRSHPQRRSHEACEHRRRASSSLSSAASAQPLPKVTVGDNPSLSGAPLYIALEKGYYRDAGVDVQLEMSGTSSDMAVMLATNRLNVIGGAISAGFFNSVAKDLPVALMFSRAISPFAHHLMIRPDLKDTLKSPADLKGRTIAIAARGAILIYELVKVLEAGGLTLNDVDIKYIPFGQQPTALTNKAVDAALMISPLQDSVAAKGIGIKWINVDDFIKVQPVVISVWMMNTDWAKANEDAAGNSCARRCAACAIIATPIIAGRTAARSRRSWRNIRT